MTMTFEEWCDELDRIARAKYNYTCDCTKSTGRECWKDAFKDGETPENALLEDMSYGD